MPDSNPAILSGLTTQKAGIWTRNGKLLFFLSLGFCFFGAASRQMAVMQIGCMVLVFVLVEWARFTFQMRWVLPHYMVIRREFPGLTEDRTVWLNSTLSIRNKLENHSGHFIDDLEIIEVLPGRLGRLSACGWRGSLEPSAKTEFISEYECLQPGQSFFPGYAVRMGSFCGLFYLEMFWPVTATVNVYPRLQSREKVISLTKRNNRALTLGLHEHRQRGQGMELLELRDYIPGDPPKKINWKATARKDELIVRENESEVPIKATVFLDVSNLMRLETKTRTQLDWSMETIAALVKAVNDNRDLLGLVCFHEDGMDILPAGRGKKHQIKLLRRMNGFADKLPRHLPSQSEHLFATAFEFANLLWPGLFHKSVNTRPKPFFRINRRKWEKIGDRKQLAQCLCVHYGFGPERIEEWLNCPDEFDKLLHRFCNEFSLRRAYDFQANVRDIASRSSIKFKHLNSALRYAIQRAKDNEIFILMTDLFGLEDAPKALIQEFEKTLKLARGKHHRVLVASPWRPAFDGFGGKMNLEEFLDALSSPVAERTQSAFPLINYWAKRSSSNPLEETLRLSRLYSYVNIVERQRFELGRLGIPFLALGPLDSASAIMQLLAQMRYQKGALK